MPDQPNGATRLFPIIGDPIEFVESPRWLTRTFTERGHNGICVPLQVPAGQLDVVMAALSASANVDGILVTMPHKQAALRHCATSSERASSLGAVSVILRNEDGGWHGDMLDGLAFVKAQINNGARVEGAKALLVGAGGAGSAIAMTLLDEGVGELVVHDADSARAEALVQLLEEQASGRVRVGPPDPSGCDLVLNASPMGMADDDPLPVDPAGFTASMHVGDVIAGHGTTAFIAAAQAAGCTTAGGGDMVAAVQELMADFMMGTDQPT